MGLHSKLLADYAYFKERPALLAVMTQAHIHDLTGFCGVVYRWQREQLPKPLRRINNPTSLSEGIRCFLRQDRSHQYSGGIAIATAFMDAVMANPSLIAPLRPRSTRLAPAADLRI